MEGLKDIFGYLKEPYQNLTNNEVIKEPDSALKQYFNYQDEAPSRAEAVLNKTPTKKSFFDKSKGVLNDVASTLAKQGSKSAGQVVNGIFVPNKGVDWSSMPENQQNRINTEENKLQSDKLQELDIAKSLDAKDERVANKKEQIGLQNQAREDTLAQQGIINATNERIQSREDEKLALQKKLEEDRLALEMAKLGAKGSGDSLSDKLIIARTNKLNTDIAKENLDAKEKVDTAKTVISQVDKIKEAIRQNNRYNYGGGLLNSVARGFAGVTNTLGNQENLDIQQQAKTLIANLLKPTFGGVVSEGEREFLKQLADGSSGASRDAMYRGLDNISEKLVRTFDLPYKAEKAPIDRSKFNEVE